MNHLKQYKNKDFTLLFILLISSGNLLVVGYFLNYTTIFCVILSFFFLNTKRMRQVWSSISKKLIVYLSLILIVSTFQLLELGSVSYLGIFNFVLKLIYAAIIIAYLGDNISNYFFTIVFWLSVVSIIGYIIFQLLKIPPFFFISNNSDDFSILFYGYTKHQFSRLSGMFWEPGAYGGMLTLMFAMNFNRLNYLLSKEKFKFLIILLNVILTFSTSTYLSMFVIFIFYFSSLNLNVFFKSLIIFIAILLFSIPYSRLEFLDEKVSDQYSSASEQKIGEFSNSRFGSALFDMHYIIKHPITGNGLNEKTRYADHQYYVEQEITKSTANAFTSGMATWGVPFVLYYLFSIWKSRRNQNNLIVLIVVLLNLQSEPWLHYPFYLGLGF